MPFKKGSIVKVKSWFSYVDEAGRTRRGETGTIVEICGMLCRVRFGPPPSPTTKDSGDYIVFYTHDLELIAY